MRSRFLQLELKFRRALLLATVAGVPLLFLYKTTWGAFNTPKLWLLGTSVGLVLILRAVGILAGSALPNTRPLAVPVLAILLPLTLSWIFASPYKSWSLWGEHERYLGLLPYVACVLLGLLLLDAFAEDPAPVLTALVVAGGLSGAYAILQWLHLDPFVWNELDQGSTLGNPNYSGSFYGMVLPLGVWLALKTRGRRRDVALLAMAPIFFAWLLSFSQGGWAAGVVGIFVLLGLSLPSIQMRRAAILAATGLFLLVLISVPIALTDIGLRLLGPTVLDRAQVAQASIAMAQEYPVLGRGPSAFALEGVRFRPSEEAITADSRMSDPHSASLVFLTSSGIVGFTGFILLGAWAAKATRKSRGTAEGAIQAPAAAALAAYFTATLVTNDELSLRTALWSLLAVVGAGTAANLIRPRGSRTATKLTSAVAMLIIGWFSVTTVNQLLLADRQALLGFRAALDNDPERSVRAFERSLAMDPTYEYRRTYGTKVGELGTRRGAAGRKYFNKMNEVFSYLKTFPDHPALMQQGRLLYAWGVSVDEAELRHALEIFRAARAIDPKHPVLAAETAEVLISLGRGNDALALLQAFEDENPPFSFFWAMVAGAHLAEENFEEALDALLLAIQLNHEDPSTIKIRQEYIEAIRESSVASR